MQELSQGKAAVLC